MDLLIQNKSHFPDRLAHEAGHVMIFPLPGQVFLFSVNHTVLGRKIMTHSQQIINGKYRVYLFPKQFIQSLKINNCNFNMQIMFISPKVII